MLVCWCVLVNYVCYNVKAVHMCLHAACTCSSVLVMCASRQAASKADYVESVCVLHYVLYCTVYKLSLCLSVLVLPGSQPLKLTMSELCVCIEPVM